MKAFVNILIKTDAYDNPEELLENVIALCEQDGLKVVWSKAKEAKK